MDGDEWQPVTAEDAEKAILRGRCREHRLWFCRQCWDDDDAAVV